MINQRVSHLNQRVAQFLDSSGQQVIAMSKAISELHARSWSTYEYMGFVMRTCVTFSGRQVLAMCKAISELHATSGRTMHIVATGALTNIALLLKLYPEVKAAIGSITLMGGLLPSTSNP